MDNKINNKDFEQFLKQNADQYRMFPSEKVWEGVYSTLHTNKRKWYGFGIALLLLSAIGVTLIVSNYTGSKQVVANDEKKSPVSITNSNVQTNTLQKPLALLSIQKKSKTSIHSITHLNHKKPDQLTASVITDNINPVSNEEIIIADATTENIKILTSDYEHDASGISKQIFSGNMMNNNITGNNFNAANNYTFSNSSGVSVKNRKIKWRIYLTPTISYRKLSENKSFLRSVSFTNGALAYAAVYNVNNVVTHKPDMGIEMGTAGSYSLTKNLKLLAGFQFNINRYGIKAFTDPGEIATIALNGGGSNDSVVKWTNYRNFNGYNSNWLQNFYFSASVPLGVELNLAGNNKTKFGIASTVQPTFIISEKAYLISTDFQNYVQVPWLIRHWNVNTSLETFVSLSTGKINWKVGPQVRYQLLSSFQNKYPVKENLFDFGLKIAVMLNK